MLCARVIYFVYSTFVLDKAPFVHKILYSTKGTSSSQKWWEPILRIENLYATNEIVENALKKAHLFFLLVGEVGAALCGGCFYFIFVFLCVLTCSPSSSCVLNSITPFFSMWFCQRRGITSSYRNFYFGEFPKFVFSFFELWANQNGSVLLK